MNYSQNENFEACNMRRDFRQWTLLFSFLIVGQTVFSQGSRGMFLRYYTEKSVFCELGATQFLGDLGGATGDGRRYGMRDVNKQSTGFNMAIGYRRSIKKKWATSSRLSIGNIRADDAFTDNVFRKRRNLHFRSVLLDFSQRFEFTILSNQLFNRQFKAVNFEYYRKGDFKLYGFFGAGVVYFEPKAMYRGEWHKLRPLSTEGQRLEGGAKPYQPYTATIPLGFGLNVICSKTVKVGIEMTYVKTFSDYMDDVGGSYYDAQKLAEECGEMSGYFSNPSSYQYSPGERRGGDGFDAYFYANVKVCYSFGH